MFTISGRNNGQYWLIFLLLNYY